MPNVPAVDRFRKLVDDISRLYVNARRAQVQFAWPIGSLREETGRRIVEEEQNGETRAAYGKELIPELSRELAKKYGPGFSENVLRKTRQFYLRNPIQPLAVELDWTDYVAGVRGSSREFGGRVPNWLNCGVPGILEGLRNRLKKRSDIQWYEEFI